MSDQWKAILIHLLAYPLYQIVSTLRHEASHAVAALLAGYKITSFRIIPHKADDGHFYWGRVTWQFPAGITESSSHVMMAPYYVDIILIVVWFVLFKTTQFENLHLWIFTTVMLLISPVVDMVYNIFKAVLFNRGDWMAVFPKT